MPWKEDKEVAEKRLEFIKLLQDGRYSMVSLCERFGISRSNGYKWQERYLKGGLDGLKDLRRAPRGSALRTPAELEALIVSERVKHRSWGPRKLLAVLRRDHPDIERWPAHSTVHQILQRNGLIQAVRRRKKHEHPGRPFVEANAPNNVWAVDYKGHFRLGNGRNCYPLTVTDTHSRFLLGCRSLTSTQFKTAQREFIKLFKAYGLPDAILTDNGAPFASTAIAGLSRLSVWWIALGIRHLRTQPASPQQNGRHERMHRTLKAEATKPPKQTHIAQQRAFDEFQHEYNQVRPHEAIGLIPPDSIYKPSQKPYPTRLPPISYPAHLPTRLVSAHGDIRWMGAQIFISRALAGERVALEEEADGILTILFANTVVGRLDVRTGKVK